MVNYKEVEFRMEGNGELNTGKLGGNECTPSWYQSTRLVRGEKKMNSSLVSIENKKQEPVTDGFCLRGRDLQEREHCKTIKQHLRVLELARLKH